MPEYLNKKLYIFFITPSFGTFSNGPSLYAKYLWDSFKNCTKYEFKVICNDSTICDSSIVQIPKIKLFWQPLTNIFNTWYFNYKLDKILINHQDSIIHYNSAYEASKKILRKYDVICQINDYDNILSLKKMFFNIRHYGFRRSVSLIWRWRREKVAIRYAKAIVVNSNYMLRCFKEAIQQNYFDKFHLIYKGADLEYFKTKYDLKRRDNILKIVYVGENWKRKGLLILIEALSNIDIKFTLTIVGPQKNDFNKKISKKIPLNQKHLFILEERPSREKIKKVLCSSDLFVLPSYAEALGIAVIEALACNLPCIVSDIGGLTEIIEDGYNGLVSKLSAIELKSMIKKIWEDEELYYNLKQKTRESVNKYDKNKMIEKISELYEQMQRVELPK